MPKAQPPMPEETFARELAELVRRLTETEAALEILISGQADAVIDPRTGKPLLLAEAQAALKESEVRYRELAHHDPLTGVANRLLLSAQIDSTLKRAKRRNERFALLFVDLDQFKAINDALGHTAGDQLLKGVAERLKKSVRASDSVARIGGDEFVILLDQIIYPEDAAIFAKKVIDAVGEPFQLEGQKIITSTSIGISVYPEDAQTSEELIKAADMAMYHAKVSGRHTYRFFTHAMTLGAAEKLELEEKLSHAQERNQFVLHYLPQVSLVNGEITTFEALTRWMQPGHGLVYPETFMAITEELALRQSLGEWVVRTAVAAASDWIKNGIQVNRISVNLSEWQIVRERTLEKIQQMVREEGWGGPRLVLEIKESALPKLVESPRRFWDLYRQGIELTVDDFGMGYSSVRFLRQLPVNALKIDKQIVEGIGHRSDDEAVIRGIIGMARGIGVSVVGEGVETEDQLEFLKAHGCDEAQGFLFSQPLPAEEIPVLFRTLGS